MSESEKSTNKDQTAKDSRDSDDSKKKDDKKSDDSNESEDKDKKKGDSDEDDDEKDEDEDEEDEDDDGKKKKGPPVYKRPAFIITVSIILLVVIVGGIIFWLHARHFASTDDAYIDGHIVQIAPQVSAYVQTLEINDNVYVHQGDLMVTLDRTVYEVAREQAKAQLLSAQGHETQARAQIESAKAAVVESAAEIDAAQVALDNAQRDLHRYETVDPRARSRQQLDNATAAEKNAEAQLAQARAKKVSAEANVNTSIASANAAGGDVQTAQASLKRAQVDLGYCEIHAPCEGRVTQRTVEVGNYVQTGEAMFMIVSPYVWITANFKETQLTYMHPGQPVTVSVDAFPSMNLSGRVDSIQAGSGSRFSVLPAENATGNFVKIVQRVPVKIIFDQSANTNDAGLLSPGLSVEPKVRIR